MFQQQKKRKEKKKKEVNTRQRSYGSATHPNKIELFHTEMLHTSYFIIYLFLSYIILISMSEIVDLNFLLIQVIFIKSSI